MTNPNHAGTPGEPPAGRDDDLDELDTAWAEFEQALAAYLGTMGDDNDEDHLRVELPDADPDGEGCPPYAQFAVFDRGAMMRAELSGNVYLLPEHQITPERCDALRQRGWLGSEPMGDGDERNWHLERPVASAEEIAHEVVWALRGEFGIPHPQLLSYEAWGPAADDAWLLGLCSSDDIDLDGGAGAADQCGIHQLAVDPGDRDELVGLVESLLRVKYEGEPVVDDDGDFVLHHLGQSVWVHVRGDQPAVEIMARVAHGVRSRRGAAVELGLLNRDNVWVRWVLRERSVWQTLLLPASPFAPRHLDAMLDLYLDAMATHRDDLALRLGAKVA